MNASDILYRIWEIHFGPLLDSVWDSVFFWRTFALAIITICFILYLSRYRFIKIIYREKINDHDESIFNKIDSILPEGVFCIIVEGLENEHACRDEYCYKLLSIERYYSQEGNKFLRSSLNKCSENLMIAISELNVFIGKSFFPPPFGGQTNHLYPELNFERSGRLSSDDMEKYDIAAEELQGHVNNVRDKYRIFRRSVKKYLLK